MSEKSVDIQELMTRADFRARVRALVGRQALVVLKHVTGEAPLNPAPSANKIAWAKAAVMEGYSGYTEALLMLSQSQPESVAAALSATDTQYDAVFAAIVDEAVLALV